MAKPKEKVELSSTCALVRQGKRQKGTVGQMNEKLREL